MLRVMAAWYTRCWRRAVRHVATPRSGTLVHRLIELTHANMQLDYIKQKLKRDLLPVNKTDVRFLWQQQTEKHRSVER